LSDDTKEWVTIKIEEPIRDAAKDDDRTYTEIMRDGLETDGSWDDSDVDAFRELFKNADTDGISVERGGLSDDVREQLDRIESAAQTAEDRTGSIQRTVEDMEARLR
jgi:MFS superfamily sulfate permease-like transporter